MTIASRRDDGGNVLEFLSDYVRRLEDVSHEFEGKDIVTSSEVQGSVEPLVEDWSISKMPVLWPLIDYKMFYIVTVPPNTTVPPHTHDEAVFRLIISGDLTINGKHVRSGEWVVVKEGVNYEVKTSTGYTALSGYTSVCRTGRGFEARLGGITPPEG